MRLTVTFRYLCFPIKNGAQVSPTRIRFPGYEAVNCLELTDGTPDFWAYLDLRYHQGQEIEVLCEGGAGILRAEDLCIAADALPDGTGLYTEPDRPLYHFTSPRGWINDPNGMVYRDGEYHMFYQLNPLGCRWFDKGWGHAKSPNMFDWEILPPALYACDKGYAISGSALFDGENRGGFGAGAWILAYSSRVGDHEELGQTIDLAHSTDGRVFTPYGGNPIISEGNALHFRDPKVFWHEPTGRFAMVMVAGEEVRFYASPDLKDWTLTGVLDNGELPCSGMIYECPELMEYEIEGGGGTRWVLQLSIFHKVVHIVGAYDGYTFRRDMAVPLQWADYGMDFYAAVGYNPFGEMNGRHVWIGWMSDWRYARRTPKGEGWMGSFTVPRELSLRAHEDGGLRVHQTPVAEIGQLAEGALPLPAELEVGLLESIPLGLLTAYDLQLEVELPQAGYWGLTLDYISGEKIVISADILAGTLAVDRAGCAPKWAEEAFAIPLTMPLGAGEKLTLRVLVDKGSLELFAQDGERCLTALCSPGLHAHTLAIFNRGSEPMGVKGLSVRPLRRANWVF